MRSLRSTIGRLVNRALAGFGYELLRLDRPIGELGASVPAEPAPEPPQDLAEAVERQRQLLRHQISSKWRLIDEIRMLSKPAKDLACPLCSHEDVAIAFREYRSECIFGGGSLVRHECPACDLIFGPQKMLSISDAELAADYEWHYLAYDEGDSTELEMRAFRALRPHKDGVYLNWGAGSWSRSLAVLRQEGWNVFGYEPHGSAARACEWMIDPTALESMKFDGIFSNNVLEHLRHPVRELTKMSSLLRPDGRMSHATPCYEYCYEYTRFHLYFFTGRSRALLAQKAGLVIDEFVENGDFKDAVLSQMRPL